MMFENDELDGVYAYSQLCRSSTWSASLESLESTEYSTNPQAAKKETWNLRPGYGVGERTERTRKGIAGAFQAIIKPHHENVSYEENSTWKYKKKLTKMHEAIRKYG